MSIKDFKLEMCNDEALGTSQAGATLIGDYIDLGAMKDAWGSAITPDIGEAGELWLNVKVSTAITSSGSPAVTVALYHHTAAAVASGAVLMTHTAVGETVAGVTLIRAKLPAGTINRYLGICPAIVTADLTAGSVDAWISMDGETPK